MGISPVMNSRTTAFLTGISLAALFVAGCGDDANDNAVTIVESPPATTAESATSAPQPQRRPHPAPNSTTMMCSLFLEVTTSTP